jgi:AcrR family transcriptional regulator
MQFDVVAIDRALPHEPRPARERLLAAATALVQTHGMQALTQARVAADAGLRQSHLTYYFPTRHDLLKAVVEVAHGGVMQAMSPPTTGERRRAPTLTQVREFLCERVTEPLMPRLMLALMSAADEDPSLRSWLVSLEASAILQLRAVFDALGLTPGEDELHLFHACLVGAAILGAQQATPESARQAGHLTRLAFDRLVAASPANAKRERHNP